MSRVSTPTAGLAGLYRFGYIHFRLIAENVTRMIDSVPLAYEPLPMVDRSQHMTMQRHAFVVNVVPELRDEYLRLHAAVWPQVEETLRACNVSNYTIFILEDTLFAYYEYVGTDHERDMELIGHDPVTREWWTHTDPCQTAFGRTAQAGERWRAMHEVWHLT